LRRPADSTDGSLSAAQRQDSAAVQALLAALATAIGNNDAAALERIWSSDYQYAGRDGEVMNRQQRLDLVKDGQLPARAGELRAPRHSAVRRHLPSSRREPSHAPTPGAPSSPLQVTHVAVRRAGQWQIVATQDTDIARCAR
jgi:hypothetical protein